MFEFALGRDRHAIPRARGLQCVPDDRLRDALSVRVRRVDVLDPELERAGEDGLRLHLGRPLSEVHRAEERPRHLAGDTTFQDLAQSIGAHASEGNVSIATAPSPRSVTHQGVTLSMPQRICYAVDGAACRL